MDQIWFGSRGTQASNSATQYNSVVGGLGWSATETNVAMICPSAGKVGNLRVALEDAPGAGNSWTFALMVDGVASALTVTISGTGTTGSDVSNKVSISAGETVSLRQIPSSTPTATVPRFTMVFTGNVANESVIMAWNGAIALNSGADEYQPMHVGVGGARSTTELDMQQMCAAPGTIKNMYVKLTAAPDPGDTDGYTFTARKGGASQSLTVNITGDSTTGNDTVNSFSVAAGDLLNHLIEPSATAPSATPNAAISVTFVADTDGESLVMGGSDDDIHASITEHILLIPFADANWGAGEEAQRTILDACILRKLYVELENQPGSGNSFAFTTRIHLNDPSDPSGLYSDGNLSVTISDTSTTGNDTSNTDIMVASESIVIQSAPTSLPTVGQAKWGCVMFIGNVASVNPGNLITKLEAAGII